LARKHVVYGYKAFNSADISTNQTSAEIEVGQSDYGSIFVSWSGTSPSGTLEVQAKNGENGTYRALDFGSTISISGNSGNHDILLKEMPFTHLKLVYTSASGTGLMTASVTFKSKGA
jgi:hypothetical protein